MQRAGGAGLDTPLHVAAQHCLDEHARLYLGRGALVDARNARGETALSAACGAARRPDEHARCLRLCALLLRCGAAADARDEDERSPLHKACGHARHGLARLLLRHGADAGALDYGGASPLARVLHTAACAPESAPQRTLQALLNHGSPTVWPDAFPKVRGGRGQATRTWQRRHPACRRGAFSASQAFRGPEPPWRLVQMQILIPQEGMAESAFLARLEMRVRSWNHTLRSQGWATLSRVTRKRKGWGGVNKRTRVRPCRVVAWGRQALVSMMPSWLKIFCQIIFWCS